MEDRTFDRLARRLSGSLDRRTGLKGLLAGLTGILGFSAAEARVQIPPTCRGVGMQCIAGDECCSGRCIAKDDGTSRCARKTSNRKKKHGGKGSTSLTCTVCANGCPYTTIEDAIANAPDGPDTVVISVAPGTYRPQPMNPESIFALNIGRSMTLQPCDWNAAWPTIETDHLTGGETETLFFLGNLDEPGNCTDIEITVTIAGFNIVGGGTISALVADCRTVWKLRSCNIRLFNNLSNSVIRNSSSSDAIIESTIVQFNTSSASKGSAIQHQGASDSLLRIDDCSINDNISETTEIEGGIIGVTSGRLQISGTTTIFYNQTPVTAYGGALYAAASLIFTESPTVRNNTGAGLGGGLYRAVGSTVTGASTAIIHDNTASTCNNYYDAESSTCVYP